MFATTLTALLLAATATGDFTMRPSGEWHGIHFVEAREYSTTGVVTRVEMSLYNKGDDKSSSGMPPAELKELLAKVVAELTPEGKAPAVSKTKSKTRQGAVEYVQRWTKALPHAELTWGVTDETTDFVRLTIDNAPAKKSAIQGGRMAGNVASAKIKANVVRDKEKGDVYIASVPMVDQGKKGYCAAAVTERVLRYYGYPIDEHQIAQMAGTTADGGTSVSAMVDTVRTVIKSISKNADAKMKLGFVDILSMTRNMDGIKKDIDAYNKAAKSLGKKTIAYNDFLQGHTFMVPAMTEAMEPEVILAMRTKDSRYRQFLEKVRKVGIDQGIPLFWGVTLGKFPEPDVPQAGGGHMRLIIGYNAKTHEILYTDSWGKGHELKRMSEDKAFAITHDVFIVKPL